MFFQHQPFWGTAGPTTFKTEFIQRWNSLKCHVSIVQSNRSCESLRKHLVKAPDCAVTFKWRKHIVQSIYLQIALPKSIDPFHCDKNRIGATQEFIGPFPLGFLNRAAPFHCSPHALPCSDMSGHPTSSKTLKIWNRSRRHWFGLVLSAIRRGIWSVSPHPWPGRPSDKEATRHISVVGTPWVTYL